MSFANERKCRRHKASTTQLVLDVVGEMIAESDSESDRVEGEVMVSEEVEPKRVAEGDTRNSKDELVSASDSVN